MKRPCSLLSCLPLLMVASASLAGDAECVKLSEQRQTLRYGSQFLLIRDQDRHFRVSFAGNQCGAISAAAKVRIHTDGKDDLLCPESGRVSTRAGLCRVAAVESIDGETFAQLSRRRR